MGLLPDNVSFSRRVLPVIAVLGLVFAAVFVVSGLPEREITQPENEPPRATGTLADGARVAGAGVVEPSSEIIDIGTALPGLVTDLLVRPGDFVEQGQPLFVVDTRALQARAAETRSQIGEAQAAVGEAEAAVREAQAAIAEARAAEATAARQLALYRDIDDPAAVSRAEVIRAEGEAATARERRQLAETRLGQAHARLAQARQRVASARAQAGSTETEIGRSTVRAPMSGQILAVNIRPGEFVSTGGAGGNTTPFIQMGETRPLYVRVDIDENEAGRVELGKPAIVSPRGGADRQVRARFVRAEPLVTPKRSLTNSASERVDVRVLQVLYELPESDGLFRVGQQIDAFIPARAGSRTSQQTSERGEE
ncbi:HlyD family efflux transporter periplasmic adaptor subunit [Qipengyuania sp. JC766]|uniref:HlyD family secretion protein n=1 Tax=Qipengyuania sp. JC766 TaxID=3232139 RepID=UPI003458FEF5